MFPGLKDIEQKPSSNGFEPFVSTRAQTFREVSTAVDTERRIQSVNQSQFSLSQTPARFVARTATVLFRQKASTLFTWTRQSLRLTKHTISVRHPDAGVLDIIALRKIRYVHRVEKEQRCLRIETVESRSYWFSFDMEDELNAWLKQIPLALSFINAPNEEGSVVSPRSPRSPRDRDEKPQSIASTDDHRSLSESSSVNSSVAHEAPHEATNASSFLPVLPFPGASDHIIDIGIPQTPADSRRESEILTSQAAKPPSQPILDIHKAVQQHLRIVSEDFPSSPPSLIAGSEESLPPTPLLASDTSSLTHTTCLTPTPSLTPFRVSPYSFRETEAQNLTGQIRKQNTWPDAQGGYADIWRAQWQSDLGPISVAVKVLRVLSQDEHIRAKIKRHLRKEVSVWHQLRHKNVVQMYGTCEGFGPFSSMVSPWYGNGNINAYLHKLGNAATLDKRLKLLTEVACGLNYLHTFSFPVQSGAIAEANIVHGDLKGANVLVNDQGEAVLADFGLSNVIAMAGDSSTTTVGGGSVRWMAPELLWSPADSVSLKTCASDTYSYGSVILEVITGERPFKSIPTDMQVIGLLMEGYKPVRPSTPKINTSIWELMERCWVSQPADRPKMSLVLSRMEKFHREHKRTFSTDSRAGPVARLGEWIR